MLRHRCRFQHGKVFLGDPPGDLAAGHDGAADPAADDPAQQDNAGHHQQNDRKNDQLIDPDHAHIRRLFDAHGHAAHRFAGQAVQCLVAEEIIFPDGRLLRAEITAGLQDPALHHLRDRRTQIVGVRFRQIGADTDIVRRDRQEGVHDVLAVLSGIIGVVVDDLAQKQIAAKLPRRAPDRDSDQIGQRLFIGPLPVFQRDLPLGRRGASVLEQTVDGQQRHAGKGRVLLFQHGEIGGKHRPAVPALFGQAGQGRSVGVQEHAEIDKGPQLLILQQARRQRRLLSRFQEQVQILLLRVPRHHGGHLLAPRLQQFLGRIGSRFQIAHGRMGQQIPEDDAGDRRHDQHRQDHD